MKKALIITIFILLSSQFSFAQVWKGGGDIKVSTGIEFYGYGTSIIANLDVGILDNISLGAGVNYNFDHKNTYLNVRGDFHFQEIFRLPREFDFYTGIDAGYNTNYSSEIGFGAHLGGRYQISKSAGIYLEIGNRGNVGVFFNL